MPRVECQSSIVSDLPRLELVSDTYDPAHHAPYAKVTRLISGLSGRQMFGGMNFKVSR